MNDTEGDRILRLPPTQNPFVVGIAEARVADDTALTRVATDLASIPSGGQPPRATMELMGFQIKRAVELANAQYFRFELRYLFEENQPTVGHLQMDAVSLPGLDAENSTRKLTIFVPFGSTNSLNGQIIFPTLDAKTRDLQAGVAYMFPSFLAHEIVPQEPFPAIIAHALGPAFK